MYRKATDRVVSKRVVGRSDDTTLLLLLLLEERGRRLYRAYSYTSLRFDDVSRKCRVQRDVSPKIPLSLRWMHSHSLSLPIRVVCVPRKTHVLLFPTTVNTHTTTPLDDDDTTTTTDTTNVVVKSLSLFFFVSFSRTFFGRRKEKRDEEKSDFKP